MYAQRCNRKKPNGLKKRPEMQKCVSANMVGIFFEGQREFMNEGKGQFPSRKAILSIGPFEEALQNYIS